MFIEHFPAVLVSFICRNRDFRPYTGINLKIGVQCATKILQSIFQNNNNTDREVDAAKR